MNNTRQNAARAAADLMHVIYLSGMAGFPADNFHAWLERLDWMFDPVVLGATGCSTPRFDDDLQGPDKPPD